MKFVNKPSELIDVYTLAAALVVAIIYTLQLNQMIKSKDINRENVESVQRALVFFSGQVGTVKRTTGGKVSSITLIVPWENTGVTPAMRGKSRVDWLVIPSDLPENFNFPDLGEDKPRQFEILPKGYGNGTMDIESSGLIKPK